MSYITQSTESLLTLACGQETTLLSESKSLAIAITSADNPSEAAMECFDSVRGAYVVARTEGRKADATSIGKGWNRIKSALRHHLKADSLVVDFPDLRTGEGRAVVQTSSEAKDERAVKKAEQEQRDNEARAKYSADKAKAENDALVGMSVEQLTASIIGTIDVWSSNHTDADRAALIDAMNKALGIEKVALAPVPEIKAPRARRTTKKAA